MGVPQVAYGGDWKGGRMVYETPVVLDLGSIADHTFTTPHGNTKGCLTQCHSDSFGEQSALGQTP